MTVSGKALGVMSKSTHSRAADPEKKLFLARKMGILGHKQKEVWLALTCASIFFLLTMHALHQTFIGQEN